MVPFLVWLIKKSFRFLCLSHSLSLSRSHHECRINWRRRDSAICILGSPNYLWPLKLPAKLCNDAGSVYKTNPVPHKHLQFYCEVLFSLNFLNMRTGETKAFTLSEKQTKAGFLQFLLGWRHLSPSLSLSLSGLALCRLTETLFFPRNEYASGWLSRGCY